MKNIFLFIVLLSITTSCSILSPPKNYKVSVIDLETNLPIDSARVDLVAVVDAIDVYNQHGFTNKKGVFKFKTNYPDRSQITFKATKDAYQKIWVDHPDGKNLGYYYNKNNKEKKVTLYLTKKTFDEIFEKPNYDVDLITEQLIANRYCRQCSLPDLEWEDIPKLLEVANNTNIINKYPIHPFSSMSSDDCYAGIVALWFIEYIRVSEQDKNTRAIGRFPYQVPQLIYFGENNFATNTKEQMLITYSNYKNWWNKVENLPSLKASKIDPLKDSNVKWKVSLNLPE